MNCVNGVLEAHLYGEVVQELKKKTIQGWMERVQWWEQASQKKMVLGVKILETSLTMSLNRPMKS